MRRCPAFPAERLTYVFSHPEARRRFSGGDPSLDFAGGAWRVALDGDVDQDELDKLGRWWEEIRTRQAGSSDSIGFRPAAGMLNGRQSPASEVRAR